MVDAGDFGQEAYGIGCRIGAAFRTAVPEIPRQ
jgi:hypothetical protein